MKIVVDLCLSLAYLLSVTFALAGFGPSAKWPCNDELFDCDQRVARGECYGFKEDNGCNFVAHFDFRLISCSFLGFVAHMLLIFCLFLLSFGICCSFFAHLQLISFFCYSFTPHLSLIVCSFCCSFVGFSCSFTTDLLFISCSFPF